jgi:hypothetical protein
LEWSDVKKLEGSHSDLEGKGKGKEKEMKGVQRVQGAIMKPCKTETTKHDFTSHPYPAQYENLTTS